MSDRILITKGSPTLDIPIEDFSGQEITNPGWVYHYEGLPLLKSYVKKRFGDVPLEVVEEDGNTYLQPKVYELAVQTVSEPQTWYSEYIQPYVQKVTSHPDFQALFGDLRINTVRNHPEGVKVFREANDFVGNTMIEIATAPWMLKNATTLAKMILLGNWKVIASALAGGYIGRDVVNNVTLDLTGKTFDEHMLNAGLNEYNTATLHPGTVGGSYAGSWLASQGIPSIIDNYPAYMNNTTPRLVPARSGIAVLKPGESFTEKYPITYQSGYSGQSGKIHGSKGNHSGHSNHRARSGGIKLGKQTDYGSVPNSLGYSYTKWYDATYENSMLPYTYHEPIMFSTFGVPETPIVITAPEPENSYVETSPDLEDWKAWYAKLPNWTKRYYEGSDSTKHGWYFIDRTGGNYNFERTRVGNNEGYVAPSLTETKVVERPVEYKVVKRAYPIDKSLIIDPQQRIRIEDAQ